MSENLFSIVPVEAWSDSRLTLETMRVLGALLSFRNKNTDVVWPSREALSVRCGGMHVVNISKATAKLCELGWLVKEGDGANSRPSHYRITVPDLSTISEIVAQSATCDKVAESATSPPVKVAESATLMVAESARGKEHTIEHTNKSNIHSAREESPRQLLKNLGVSDQHAADWIKIRKQKRLAITQSALDAIRREAEKAGISFTDAIRICCEEGWGGFKASWQRSATEPQSKQGAPPWWSSEQLMLAKGTELGLMPERGESWGKFKGRINAKIAATAGRNTQPA